ncbi:hypothetical protein BK120_21625 [Paenibacillus sp. FSL A5-0031]|uniref:helix-turn-helix domain-containing protein n=1 Tax=Paenibacillus sp. FSL A5-0031 TaxID=1920420 RepID=UPI00096F5417|nr:hypothetical protein BK120_21625 [Paenibacillus sp. FSL A5-0031]
MASLRYGSSRLPMLLAQNNMSQSEFSRKLGVSKAFITKLISGERKLSVLRLRKSAEILGCSMEDLYTWE